MAILDSDCHVIYGVREVQFRALNADGSDTTDDWVATDCPVEVGVDPDIEEGARQALKCGDRVKNVVKEDDQLFGATIRFSMGCRNPEIEYIIAGSVGTILYSGSPAVATGFEPPTLAEQASAVPFEMRAYRSRKDGSNDDGFEEVHIFQCVPTFTTLAGSQEEYGTVEWSISAVENPAYSPPRPVWAYNIVTSIPS